VLAGQVAAIAIYVHAASSATVNDVPDGNYEVYIATGTDWDPVNHLFTRGCGFQKMDTPIVGGNVQMTKLSPGQFPQS